MKLKITTAIEGDWTVITLDGNVIYAGHGDIHGGWLLSHLFQTAMGYDSVEFEEKPGEEM